MEKPFYRVLMDLLGVACEVEKKLLQIEYEEKREVHHFNEHITGDWNCRVKLSPLQVT